MLSALLPKIAGMEQKRMPYRLRPSGCSVEFEGKIEGKCPRAQVYDRLGVAPSPMPGRMILRLDDSSWHEELTKDWLRKSSFRIHSDQMGIDCFAVDGVSLSPYFCPTCERQIPGNLVHGHIDGLLTDIEQTDRLFEHKAINHFSFESCWEGTLPLYYIVQPCIYFIGVKKLVPDLREISLLIKNKNTAQYIDYLFGYDTVSDTVLIKELEHSSGERVVYDPPLEIRGLVTSAVGFWKATEESYQKSVRDGKPVLPPRPFWIDDWQCQYCDYFQTCWGDFKKEFESLATDAEMEGDIIDTCRYYLEVNMHRLEMEKEEDGLKEKVKAVMAIRGIRAGRAGQYVITLSLKDGSRVDQSLIPKEILDRARVPTMSQRLQIKDADKVKMKRGGKIKIKTKKGEDNGVHANNGAK